MKKINKNTILKQGEKTYQPVEVDGIIYWVDRETQIIGNNFTHIYNPHHNDIWALDVNQISIAQAEGDRLEFGGGGVVAQSQLKLEGIPVISLNKYVERLAVEFADFIHENCIKALDGKFIYNTEQLTTAELYKIFKTESNGK